MSTTMTGTVVEKETPTQGIANLRVVVRDESALFSEDLATATTGADGSFNMAYAADLNPEMGTRKFGIYVYTSVYRQLYYVSEDDITGSELALGNIAIPTAEATNWTVTLGGSGNATPVRDGNAVRFLIDNETAWGHAKDAMLGATASINAMQLEFDAPPAYAAAPPNEQPAIVLSFGSPVDPLNPRKVLDPTDYRPERIMLDKASQGIKVRLIMPHMDLTDVSVGTAVIEIALSLFILIFAPLYLHALRAWKDIMDYLAAAGSTTDDEGFRVTPFNVVHAKLVLVDDSEAIVIGSPFNQGYWDTTGHHVYEPRRGAASGEPVPIHDVSVGVRGPAVKDIHDAFRLHWNTSDPGSPVAEIPVAAAVDTLHTGEDAIISLQLVRTLNAGAFPAPLAQGEQGILEGYLRALEQAQKYIYLENQYFTNEAIGKALVAALNDTTRPALQIIVMLNLEPDLPCYTSWQANLIGRIRKDAGANASRIEFFTAWTHDDPMPTKGHTNPMIMANYLHTKAAIVDGVWATIGSANLDGASLDAFQFLHAIQFGNNVNHEFNYLFFNGIDGHPGPGAGADAIDLFRRELWSEHLGIDAGDPKLASTDTNNADWLTLWKATAANKLSGLIGNPATTPASDPTLGRVLKHPDQIATDPGSFLKNLSVPLVNLDLIEKVPSFSFANGAWKS